MAKKYFYKIEYTADDLLHKGDLSRYSDALRLRGDPEQAKAAADQYWSGEPHSTEPPRIEVLVRKATVLEREEYKPEPPKPVDDSDYPFLSGR
ncbi:hypothetical protein ACVDG5_006915 [Mesorhizobium sp. ORM6]